MLSVADVHDSLFAFARQRVREGQPLREVQREVDESTHFVQVTPPGSACSIAFGRGISPMEPGSLKGLQVVVADADEAFADLRARGVECGEVDEQPWGRFVYFTDPDGNAWSVQQLPSWSAGVS